MPLHEVLRMIGAAILALMGLLIARDDLPVISTQHIGLGLFLFGVGYGLLLVKRHYDRTLQR